MRKRLLVLSLIPIVLFAMVSCDGDILSSISGFMGATEGNVLINSGLVTVDTTEVDTVTTTVSNFPEDTAPSVAQIDTLQDSLSKILISPQKTEVLVKEMAKTIEVSDETKDRLEDYLPKDENTGDVVTTLTQGDLVAAELIANVVNKVPLDETGEIDVSSLTDDEKVELISDALQVVEVVKAISSVGAISIDAILDDLLAQFSDDSSEKTSSLDRTATRETELQDILEPLGEMFLAPFKTGENEWVVDSAKLNVLVNNFHTIRMAYENMAPALETSERELGLNHVVNYAMSVVFAEGNAFLSCSEEYTMEEVLEDIIAFMEDDSADEPAFVTYFQDEGIWDDVLDAYADYSKSDMDTTARFDKIEATVIALSGAVPNNETITDGITEKIAEVRSELDL